MNSYPICLGLVIGLASIAFGQTEAPSPDIVLPDGASWIVTVRGPKESTGSSRGHALLSATGEESDPAKKAFLESLARTTVVRIEAAYSSGVRRENLVYANGSSLLRHISEGLVFYPDPETNEILREDAARTTTGPVTGIARLEEFAWISPKYYAGEGRHAGKKCFVYRQFAADANTMNFSPADRDPDLERLLPSPGLGPREVDPSRNPQEIATAFIDSETRRPLALITRFESRDYAFGPNIGRFSLPQACQNVFQAYKDGIKRREQRYRIPQ